MMAHFLQEPTFNRGVSNYLKANKFSNAHQDELWRHLTAVGVEDGSLAGDMTVKAIMDTWTLQMGYPLLTVTRDYNGSVTISQTRFLTEDNNNNTGSLEEEEEEEYRWWIPVSYVTPGGDFNRTVPQFWLRPQDQEIQAADNLIALYAVSTSA